MATEGRVSKPTLYRTIGDKDAIVMALSESLVDRIDRAVSAATAPSREPRAAFASSVHAYLESVAADRNVFLFVNAGGHDTEQLRRLVDRSSAGLIDTFVGARRAAGLDPTPATTWAHAIIGAFQMVTVMWLGDEYCDLDGVAEHLTQLFWPGIAGIAAG
jgi:AcrR family transcriptional regulator